MVVTPNYTLSADFLHWAQPNGPWCLIGIAVDEKNLEGMTFHPGQEDRLATWLGNVGNTHNIYWTVNPVSRNVCTKPRRSDIREMAWLHVDVDPRPDQDLDDERKHILGKLKAFDPEPSCIIFSGGGYQAFWRLTEPFAINGKEALYEEAKRYNLQLELVLGGDHCHSVDHIMRLPGTVNRPNEKKRKKGRTEALASVIYQTDVSYDLQSFTPAPQVQGAEKGFTSNTVKVSGNVSRVTDLVNDPRVEKLGDQVKRVIAQGTDPDDPTRWESRSEPLFWVCCEMVRADIDDDTIYAVITDPVWDISISVLDKASNTHAYAIRQIERAHEEAIDPMLRELNEEYAVVVVGGKTRILTEKEDVIDGTRRNRIHYMSFADFTNFYLNRVVTVGKDKKGKAVTVPVGPWWLTHANRRTYNDVIFSPGKDVSGSYNLWKGFAVEARPGDNHRLYMEHVKENVCQGSEETYRYTEGWMALSVQRPAQPGQVAIVLRGRQGTGKGMFANMFGALWGKHFLAIRDSNHLFGQFNAHLQDCVVLFADEAFWAGDKKRESMLKSLVTESQIMSERKGFDAVLGQNYVHLIMASNEDWVVPAGVDDRRFLVLDVGDAHMRDTDFFAEMIRQMKDGGYENLLHHLMTMDLSDFNVHQVPQTKALRDQKMHSFSAEEEWWFSKLLNGQVFDDRDWPENVWVTELGQDFTSYLKTWTAGVRSNQTRLGMFLKRACSWFNKIQINGDHNVMQMDGTIKTISRPYAYEVPTLEMCRKHWDDHFGGPYEWPVHKVVEPDDEPRRVF